MTNLCKLFVTRLCKSILYSTYELPIIGFIAFMFQITRLLSFAALPDVIHAVAKYEVEHEPREIFFFREGSIVMWNISDLECGNLLQFLRSYEQNQYMEELVHTESELMTYTYAESGYLYYYFFISLFFSHIYVPRTITLCYSIMKKSVKQTECSVESE